MLLSIITGTYNRLPYLKDFISSCRNNIPSYWEYEFVICDAQSTDGTIEFLESQSDVTLIQHGELKGAIKAFNDCAKLAKGDYLLVGNDDVVIQPGSIINGMSFMLSRPDVGGGCFYQDRADRDPHVEYMNVSNEGEDLTIPYVQVGIIPRWLWDHCGGWGDFGSRTYGGDNYVSAKILEAGYKIEAIDGTMIHDATPYDELRRVNNEVNEGGADGRKFYDQFPEGVKYNSTPQVKNPLEFKKILYAPIIEQGYPEAKKQKTGLRDALSKIGVVLECDYFSGEKLSDYARAWKPDMCVMQIHNADEKMVEEIAIVRSYCDGLMINWVGDVYDLPQKEPLYTQMLQNFDLQTGVNISLKQHFEDNGIKYHYFQVSYEPGILGKSIDKIFEKLNGGYTDITFLANGYSKERQELGKFLKSLPYDVKIFGNQWPEGMAEDSTLYDFDKIGKIVRNSKLVIGDSQFPDAEGFVSDRLFSSLASGGALLLHQTVKGMEELIGFKDGEHYARWDSFEDLGRLLEFYLLDNQSGREKIAKAGTKYCRESHSFDCRVQELMEVCKDIKSKTKTISASLICKDEVKDIERVIYEELKWCDEIIVVDTGSTDGTLEALKNAASYGDIKLYELKWDDNFAEARNFARHKCSSDWIFWMDFDDHFDEKSIEALSNFKDWDLAKYGIVNPLAFQFPLTDSFSGQQFMQTKMFRNLPSIYWEGRLHETVDQSILRLGQGPIPIRDCDAVPVTITHTGHEDKKTRDAKQRRNLRILDKEPDSLEKYVNAASSMCSINRWADAVLIYQIILDEEYFVIEDKEAKDYLWFCLGYCYDHIPLGRFHKLKALECFERSEYLDAYYCKGTLTKNAEDIWKFLRGKKSLNFPSFKDLWVPEAKEALKIIYNDRLGDLS